MQRSSSLVGEMNKGAYDIRPGVAAGRSHPMLDARGGAQARVVAGRKNLNEQWLHGRKEGLEETSHTEGQERRQ